MGRGATTFVLPPRLKSGRIKEVEVSLYGKFSLGLVFLLAAGAHANAQWGSGRTLGDSPRNAPGEVCREIAVVVTDNSGSAIMGAEVKTDKQFVQNTTDANGIVAIPCRAVDSFPIAEISAPGYKPARVTILPNGNSHLEVRLDKRESSLPSGRNTINVAELSGTVQQKSARLQDAANRALSGKDYDSAQELLLEAFRLTPSTASIANNLGVIALTKKDLRSAGSWFEKAHQTAPFRADIQGNLGLVRWMQGQTEESYRILRQAFERGYESNMGHYVLGVVGLEKGEYEASVAHLKNASADRFPYRDLYLSIALHKCGKSRDADAIHQSFLKKNRAPFAISLLAGAR